MTYTSGLRFEDVLMAHIEDDSPILHLSAAPGALPGPESRVDTACECIHM